MDPSRLHPCDSLTIPQTSHTLSWLSPLTLLLQLDNCSSFKTQLEGQLLAEAFSYCPVLPPQYTSIMHLDLSLRPSVAISLNVRTMSKSLPENSEDPEVSVEWRNWSWVILSMVLDHLSVSLLGNLSPTWPSAELPEGKSLLPLFLLSISREP